MAVEIARMGKRYSKIVGCPPPTPEALEYITNKFKAYTVERMGQAFLWLVDQQETALSMKNPVFPMVADFRKAISATYREPTGGKKQITEEEVGSYDGYAERVVSMLVDKFGVQEDTSSEKQKAVKTAKEKREQHRSLGEVFVYSQNRWVQKQYAIDNDLTHTEQSRKGE